MINFKKHSKAKKKMHFYLLNTAIIKISSHRSPPARPNQHPGSNQKNKPNQPGSYSGDESRSEVEYCLVCDSPNTQKLFHCLQVTITSLREHSAMAWMSATSIPLNKFNIIKDHEH